MIQVHLALVVIHVMLSTAIAHLSGFGAGNGASVGVIIAVASLFCGITSDFMWDQGNENAAVVAFFGSQVVLISLTIIVCIAGGFIGGAA